MEIVEPGQGGAMSVLRSAVTERGRQASEEATLTLYLTLVLGDLPASTWRKYCDLYPVCLPHLAVVVLLLRHNDEVLEGLAGHHLLYLELEQE